MHTLFALQVLTWQLIPRSRLCRNGHDARKAPPAGSHYEYLSAHSFRLHNFHALKTMTSYAAELIANANAIVATGKGQ